MRLIEELSWPEIEAGLSDTKTIILPVGAIEEHGPHLPIFTDAVQAVEVAKEAARRTHVFLASPISYGICRSTRGFPGTITVGFDSLRAYVHDVLVSFYDSGFRRVLLLTGHAGGQHVNALEQACHRAIEEREFFRISLASLFDLIDRSLVETFMDGHAGEIETSLMMVIRNDLVKGLPEGYFPHRPKYLVLRDIKHLMGNGIMGDPSKASLEKGKVFFEMAVQGVIGALNELETFPEN
jgi:creatinine amidohydrolase